MKIIRDQRICLFRKASRVVLGLTFVAALTACEAQGNNELEANPASPAAVPSANLSNKSTNPDQQKDDQSVNSARGDQCSNFQTSSEQSMEKTPEYMGEWKVIKQLPTPISGLSDEEAEEYIGQIFRMEEDRSGFAGDSVKYPTYSVKSVTKADYEDGNRVTLAEWGMEGDSIQEISIRDDQAVAKDAYSTLADLINGHLVISIEGQYFDLEKQEATRKPPLLDQTSLKIGDQCLGLTVKDVKKADDGSLTQVAFSGEVTVEGNYEYDDDSGDGAAYLFTVDPSDIDKLPILDKAMASDDILITNSEEAEKILPGEKGHAKVILRNYTLANAQISRTAELVKVIQK